jgi:DNA primase large subunit
VFQFVKGYAYSFRHMYGKEGARKNYTPYSCMKIIMGTPPEAGAHHGCPFRYDLVVLCCVVWVIEKYDVMHFCRACGLSGTWATPV